MNIYSHLIVQHLTENVNVYIHVIHYMYMPWLLQACMHYTVTQEKLNAFVYHCGLPRYVRGRAYLHIRAGYIGKRMISVIHDSIVAVRVQWKESLYTRV